MTRTALTLIVLATTTLGFAQSSQDPVAFASNDLACSTADIGAVDITVHLPRRSKNCVKLAGGFSGVPGSFVGLSYIASNFLHLGEVLSVNGELSVRRRRVQADFTKTSLLGKPIESGFGFYAQRFSYNQARESSIFAFQRDIPQFSAFGQDNLLKFVSYSYGTTAFVRYRLRSAYRIGIAYSYDASDIRTLSASTSDYFSYLRFEDLSAPNEFNSVRTSKLTPSFSYNNLDNAVRPTRGTAVVVSTGIAGLGGNVSTVEPSIEAKYFHPGFRTGHVIGFHMYARMLHGYADGVPPGYDRYYAGGEDEIRGFDSWSITPIGYEPGIAAVNQLNTDGTPRLEKIVDASGNVRLVNVQQTIPVYRLVSLGGDTTVITNVEYRVPIAGPLTLAWFYDAGVNRVTFRDQIRLDPRLFPAAPFKNHIILEPATQKIRMSTGAELQFLPQRFNVPLRFYIAYNPLVYRATLNPPVLVDPSYFPNAATTAAVLHDLQAPIPLRERRFMFRFSIGRTF